MSSIFFIITLLVLWITTLAAFILYLAGRKKRHKKAIDDHLSKHDQVFLALQKSEDRYQKLINYMNEGLIFTDEKNKICFVNKCACAILKSSPDKILNRSVTEFLLSPSDVRKLGLPYELKRHGCSHREEIQLVRNNGEMFWANLNISYLDTLHDHTPGAIIVMTDITEKKLTEDKLHNLTLNLNQRVKQLDCLFEVSDISNTPGIGFEQILEKTLKIIPHALRYPDDVWVDMLVNDKRYVTKNFKETKLSYLAPIKGSKRKFGTLRIGYRESKWIDAADAIPVGEKIVIKNIAEKLAQIIELKELETSLNKGIRELVQLQQITQIGRWEWELSNRGIIYSEEFFTVLQIDKSLRETYNPDVFYQQIHDEDLPIMQNYVKKVLDQSINDFSFSFRFIPRPGITLYVIGNGILLTDKAGKPYKLIGTVQDITRLIRRFAASAS